MYDEQFIKLMERMYSDIRESIASMDRNLQDMTSRIAKLEESQLRMENELEDARKILYDAYIQNAEAVKELDERVHELSGKVDNHAIKIQVIEGGKKAL